MSHGREERKSKCVDAGTSKSSSSAVRRILTTRVPAGPIDASAHLDVGNVCTEDPENGPRFGSYVHVVYGNIHYGASVVLYDCHCHTKLDRVIFDADENGAFADIDFANQNASDWHYATDPHPSALAELHNQPVRAIDVPEFLVGHLIQLQNSTDSSTSDEMLSIYLAESYPSQNRTKCVGNSKKLQD